MFECQEVLEAPFAFENPPRAPSYERKDAEMFLNGSFPTSFSFIFVMTVNKFLPMTGFEQHTSDIGSDKRTFVFATRGHCIKGKQCQCLTITN